MRKLAPLMFAVAAVLSAGPAAASVQFLRIQAWNLQQCYGTDNVCDVHRQARTMVQSSPDIILTSEIIEGDIATYLADLNALTGATWDYHFIPICPRATCDGASGQGQAIFSRLAPSSKAGIFFTGQDRSAVAMIFNDLTGRRIAIVGTHLAANGWDNNRDPDNSDLRAAAMTEMKAWAAGLAPVQIIGGDFNFNPTQMYGGATELSQMTSAGYIESWQKALEAGAASSYPDNPPSMDTRTRRSRIDYVFYIGSGLDATSSTIRDIRDLNNTNVQILVGNSDDRGVRPSDHNMVETVIAVSAGSDTTPPSVALTAPSAGATVSGAIAVSADATDNIGVVGVQFKLDDQNLGAEDTTAPYSVSWNTASASNGTHVLKAVARDAAGNPATSASVTVTVSNTSGSGSLVGHWKFDEGSGTTAADSSGNGTTGMLINSPAWTTGVVGGALSFNGTTSLVSIPNQPSWNTASSKYTVAFWVKVNEIKDYAGAVAVGNWGTGALEIMTTGRQWMFRIKTSGGPNGWGCDGTSSTLGYLTTHDNTFHHVALVLDAAASRCQLYSDGTPVATDIYVDGTTSFGAQSLNIGGFGDANRLKSVIDDVRLYNAALTQAEVQALANPVPDTTPPSVAITAPSAGATVSGAIAVSADATDNIGVVGVQFKLDDQNLGAEDTAAPYSVSWNTASASNGTHVLKAVARDAAGNPATSASVTVTVSNTSGSGSLVGHWKFDEGSGTTAADSSGNGTTGMLINSPAWTTGIVGGALSFNGTTNLVSIPNQPSWKTAASKYTVAFWIKVNEIKSYAGAVAVGNWGTGELEIMTTSNQWMFRIKTSGGPNGWGCDGTSSTLGYLTTPDNAFHHVALVLDAAASRCQVYSDGTPVATDIYVDGTTSFGAQSLNIGGFGDANRLKSVIDDVRLYNAALTQAEVQALANPVPDTTPPSVAITAPSAGATVSGAITVSANATDNVG